MGTIRGHGQFLAGSRGDVMTYSVGGPSPVQIGDGALDGGDVVGEPEVDVGLGPDELSDGRYFRVDVVVHHPILEGQFGHRLSTPVVDLLVTAVPARTLEHHGIEFGGLAPVERVDLSHRVADVEDGRGVHTENEQSRTPDSDVAGVTRG